MTKDEQKLFNDMHKFLSDMKRENEIFKNLLSEKVLQIDEKVNAKYIPINLENDILHSVQDGINKILHDILSSYNSPLSKLVSKVIEKHKETIEEAFDAVVSEEINNNNFSDSIKQEFIKKIAKSVLSGIDGTIDKTVNAMKQDSIFRAKLTLMINILIDEWKGGK